MAKPNVRNEQRTVGPLPNRDRQQPAQLLSLSLVPLYIRSGRRFHSSVRRQRGEVRSKIKYFNWDGKYRMIEEPGFGWFDGPNVVNVQGKT